MKFKAFDKINKEWWFCEIPHGSFLNELALEGNKKREFRNTDLQAWCQYTGLKDKSGKEIYEGDIVKEAQIIDGNFVSVVIKIFEVIYQGVSFQYQPIPKSNHTVSPIGSEVKIIGNIHENPELMESL